MQVLTGRCRKTNCVTPWCGCCWVSHPPLSAGWFSLTQSRNAPGMVWGAEQQCEVLIPQISVQWSICGMSRTSLILQQDTFRALGESRGQPQEDQPTVVRHSSVSVTLDGRKPGEFPWCLMSSDGAPTVKWTIWRKYLWKKNTDLTWATVREHKKIKSFCFSVFRCWFWWAFELVTWKHNKGLC